MSVVDWPYDPSMLMLMNPRKTVQMPIATKKDEQTKPQPSLQQSKPSVQSQNQISQSQQQQQQLPHGKPGVSFQQADNLVKNKQESAPTYAPTVPSRFQYWVMPSDSGTTSPQQQQQQQPPKQPDMQYKPPDPLTFFSSQPSPQKQDNPKQDFSPPQIPNFNKNQNNNSNNNAWPTKQSPQQMTVSYTQQTNTRLPGDVQDLLRRYMYALESGSFRGSRQNVEELQSINWERMILDVWLHEDREELQQYINTCHYDYKKKAVIAQLALNGLFNKKIDILGPVSSALRSQQHHIKRGYLESEKIRSSNPQQDVNQIVIWTMLMAVAQGFNQTAPVPAVTDQDAAAGADGGRLGRLGSQSNSGGGEDSSGGGLLQALGVQGTTANAMQSIFGSITSFITGKSPEPAPPRAQPVPMPPQQPPPPQQKPLAPTHVVSVRSSMPKSELDVEIEEALAKLTQMSSQKPAAQPRTGPITSPPAATTAPPATSVRTQAVLPPPPVQNKIVRKPPAASTSSSTHTNPPARRNMGLYVD